MLGIVGIIVFLAVLGLSLAIIRVATIALALTGLSEQAARFQARSAFTGTGFTTSEAEKVVNHPVRRRIIMLLMIVRSAGLITILISLVLSFVGTGDQGERLGRLLWLFVGVMILWWLARSRWVDRYLSRVIRWALKRWTNLDVRDYASLLRLSGNYSVRELGIQEGDWLAGKSLKDCRLTQEGILVLGIHRRDGTYVGAPRPDTEIYEDDTLLLYGHGEALEDLDRRRADTVGEAAHQKAVTDQMKRMSEQDAQEAEYQRKRQEKA
jgi:hypothetical protein